MQKKIEVEIDLGRLELLCKWASTKDYCAFYLTSHRDFTAAIGAKHKLVCSTTKGSFEALERFHANSKSRISGYLGYDLKNDLEDLQSENPDCLDMPEALFFEPLAWLRYSEGILSIEGEEEYLIEIKEVFKRKGEPSCNTVAAHLEALTDRNAYLQAGEKIKNHLKRGDIYEANYCVQFKGRAEGFDPAARFLRLYSLTEAPFSVFAKLGDYHILSASPERFLKNSGGRLISQPIKGTAKRSIDPLVDRALKETLPLDPKERSENVMIVDLVRNDLSRVAARNSVEVEELFGVQTFKTVHHLVSTIRAELNTDKYNSWDAIKACFPMGSMTGAPKISAMKIIEEVENFKRGAYSGAFGWMDPDGDFDFNVLIRTLMYNSSTQNLAFAVGSAITISASPEKEYEECLLKAQALLSALDTRSLPNETTASI